MYQINLNCKNEVYEEEKEELKNGLVIFLHEFMGGKYCNFNIEDSNVVNSLLAEVRDFRISYFHTKEIWVKEKDVIELLKKHFA